MTTLADVLAHGSNIDNLPLFSFLNVPSSAGALAMTTPASSAECSSATVPSPSGFYATTASATVPGLTLKKRQSLASPADLETDPEVLIKRQRNSLAARKYRQKKVDRIGELEAEVGQLKQERETLRIQLARQEAETAALREMLLGGGGNDGGVGRKRKKRTARSDSGSEGES